MQIFLFRIHSIERYIELIVTKKTFLCGVVFLLLFLCLDEPRKNLKTLRISYSSTMLPLYKIANNVAHLHHLDMDPDPTFHFDPDPDLSKKIVEIKGS